MTVVKLYAVNHLHGCLQVLTIGYYGHIFSVGLPNKWENKLLADNVTLNSSSESNRSWSAGLFRCILLCSRHAARTARFNRRLVNFLLMMQPELRKRMEKVDHLTKGYMFQRNTHVYSDFLYTSIFWSIMLKKSPHLFPTRTPFGDWWLLVPALCVGFLGGGVYVGAFSLIAQAESTYQPG